MHPIPVPDDFRIIAHRGASAYAPENTRPAFQLAREMSIREVELDTQLATDGVVMVCHDKVLDRYGYPGITLEERTSRELLALDMGSWFSPHLFAGTPMMTLEQLLTEFGNEFVLHIELKGRAAGLAAAVHAQVVSCGLLSKSIFTSFSVDHLKRLRKISGDCRLGLLLKSFEEETLDVASSLKLFQLCPSARFVSRDIVAQCRQVVPEVRVWGLSGKPHEVRSQIHRVLDSGADGMTLDWPDWVSF